MVKIIEIRLLTYCITAAAIAEQSSYLIEIFQDTVAILINHY